jgi:hypothetical protein
LTDQNSAFTNRNRDARAEWQRARARILADIGVTPGEAALLAVVALTDYVGPTNPPGYVSDDLGVTVEEYQAAVGDCFAKGWLQVLDAPAAERIARELRDGGILGPVYGNTLGEGVDFTPAGAELYLEIRRRCAPPGGDRPLAYTDVVHCKTARYFRSRTAALRGIEEARGQDSEVTIVGPEPIGPWRAQWWRLFPEGYLVLVEERRQWQGFCGPADRCFMPPRAGADPERLRQALDRHGVAHPEWLLLNAMESGCPQRPSRLPGWVSRSAARQGVTASEEECRAGLEACFHKGWLRVVDEAVGQEIDALLHQTPALTPVTGRQEWWGGVDFTPRGADLYRMIAAEWLGPEWEDELRVEEEIHREEHRYCEAEMDVQAFVGEYAAGGEVVRASRLVPIGPWCIRWWHQFPAGYRLELEIGDPRREADLPGAEQ